MSRPWRAADRRYRRGAVIGQEIPRWPPGRASKPQDMRIRIFRRVPYIRIPPIRSTRTKRAYLYDIHPWPERSARSIYFSNFSGLAPTKTLPLSARLAVLSQSTKAPGTDLSDIGRRQQNGLPRKIIVLQYKLLRTYLFEIDAHVAESFYGC